MIHSCLQEAAVQCRKQLSLWLGDREELLKQLLDWAFGGFKPAGPDRVGGESPLAHFSESKSHQPENVS